MRSSIRGSVMGCKGLTIVNIYKVGSLKSKTISNVLHQDYIQL